jgi:hypothetical protein
MAFVYAETWARTVVGARAYATYEAMGANRGAGRSCDNERGKQGEDGEGDEAPGAMEESRCLYRHLRLLTHGWEQLTGEHPRCSRVRVIHVINVGTDRFPLGEAGPHARSDTALATLKAVSIAEIPKCSA